MLIDIGFLGLELHLSNSQDSYNFIQEARIIDSRFTITHITKDNVAPIIFDIPIPYDNCFIVEQGIDYMSNTTNPYSSLFETKIMVLQKMIKENLTKENIIEYYPELII